MGAIVMDKAIIEENCLIGAGSVVTEGTIIPAGTLAFGSPARVVRDLNEKELKMLAEAAKRYIEVGREYKKQI